MIDVFWESYHIARSPMLFGDQIMLRELFSNHPDEFEQHVGIRHGSKGALVNIPLYFTEGQVDRLNADIRRMDWVLIICTANEPGSDAYREINHPNKKIWVQTPKASDEADRYLPIGYPAIIKQQEHLKTMDWFFAGQATNDRRIACIEQLDKMEGGELLATNGFNQGMPHDEYIEKLFASKVAPCPGGPSTPDTFRVYESLEAGCVPIVDMACGAGTYFGNYWEKVFGKVPFPLVSEWSALPEVMQEVLDNYEDYQEATSLWWAEYKEGLYKNLMDDINELRSKV